MIFLSGTIAKMLLSLSYVLWYKTAKMPEGINFIWSFLACFLAFTVFEVVFLTKIAKE